MLEGRSLSPAYNFAPSGVSATVLDVATAAARCWGVGEDRIVIEPEYDVLESGVLNLDARLAQSELGWSPLWLLDDAITATIQAYRDPTVGRDQIAEHLVAVG